MPLKKVIFLRLPLVSKLPPWGGTVLDKDLFRLNYLNIKNMFLFLTKTYVMWSECDAHMLAWDLLLSATVLVEENIDSDNWDLKTQNSRYLAKKDYLII